jgi:glutathione synthase/RimK-type ligase-like ATP-grasp enzyme
LTASKLSESGIPEKPSLVASNTAKAATETYRNLGLDAVFKPAVDGGREGANYARTTVLAVDGNFTVSSTAKSANYLFN